MRGSQPAALIDDPTLSKTAKEGASDDLSLGFKHGTDFNCDDATMAYEAAANRQAQLRIPTL
jgi:hypothetical protein